VSVCVCLCVCVCVCRLRTLWYTFTSLHNSVEIEVVVELCFICIDCLFRCIVEINMAGWFQWSSGVR